MNAKLSENALEALKAAGPRPENMADAEWLRVAFERLCILVCNGALLETVGHYGTMTRVIEQATALWLKENQ